MNQKSITELVKDIDSSLLNKIVEAEISELSELENNPCEKTDCPHCLMLEKLKATKLYELLNTHETVLLFVTGLASPATFFITGFIYALKYYEAQNMENLFQELSQGQKE